MNRLLRGIVGIMTVLSAGAIARAELQLVVDFEGFSGTRDGTACNGVLGGFIDSESENTGNTAFGTVGGSNGINYRGHSSGTLRAVGVGGIANPIDEGETGIGFCRFMVRSASLTVRTHIGLIADATDDPINGTTAADPLTVPAGIRLVGNAAGFDVVTLDGATVLRAGLARGQWYNLWIVADNGADTFDLYLSEVEAPGGAATLPTPDELVQRALPFAAATTEPLNGIMFSSPTGTGQAEVIYIDDIWWDGDQGLSAPTLARSPMPADGAVDVPRDVILSWSPAPSAATHNVYFGTSFDDVNGASVANPLAVLVGPGQDANSLDPDGLLAFGQTYYWRVDEVNGTPDHTVFPGSVWSFTAEPFSYPVEGVQVTASIAPFPGAGGPEKTIDGSGLDTATGQHSVADADVWLGDASAGGPVWIQYDFGRLYRLYDLRVWNYNTIYESFVGFGVRDVTIEYAAEPNGWVSLGDFEIARAPGSPDYTGTSIDLGGIAAKAVRISLKSNWGGEARYGLSEVRFAYIPTHAREPEPASGTTGLDPTVVLGWRAGREAAAHQVHFGTDPNAVAGDTALIDTAAANRYDLGSVNLGTTYYWKIVEANETETPSAWAGDVWNFSTKEYVTIEDFESYSDDEGNRIYETWLDGYEVAANGSLVGHENQPFAEKTVVHGGAQSMPLYYTNLAPVANSEAVQTLVAPLDLTANGADSLSLWFRGDPLDFVETASGIIASGRGSDIWGTADQGRFVYKQLTGDGTIVARVDHLDNVDVWAKAGVMIRQSLDANASWALALASAANGVHFQARLSTGASAVSDTSLTLPQEQTGADVPVWVKLERVGNRFNMYYATDAAPTAWVANPWNPQTIAMTDPVFIGLAITSHNTSATAQAAFSALATTGNVTGVWQTASLGVDQPEGGNGLDAFYLAVEDSAGRKATLFHPSPYAVGVGAWTQWLVPLSDLGGAGVDLKSVRKLYLGVGDETKPSRNASGLLYLDDIAFGNPIPAE